MARTGVTREQVFETADALVREGQNPTVVAVRTRLGGGSPNTITPLLAEWKTLNETKQAAAMPAVPEPVEAVMRQVWGAAWQQAQGQLEGEREALGTARKEIERERAEMLSEIGRMDTEMETARGSLAKGADALEAERQAHERTKSDVREAQAIAAERAERIAVQEKELQGLRHQIEEASVQASARASRLESERDHAQADLEAVRTELRQEQENGKRPACRVSPRETRRVRPMPPGTRAMATTYFVPRPPCGRSGDSTTHQPSPTAPTNGWTGCRMPLQILSAGSGIHPLRHYDNPYGLYPSRGLPAFA